jgi:hypothetical protein
MSSRNAFWSATIYRRFCAGFTVGGLRGRGVENDHVLRLGPQESGDSSAFFWGVLILPLAAAAVYLKRKSSWSP